MPALYTCECQDGRVLTGNSRWTPTELKLCNPLQLAQIITETKEFASYYTANFYRPIQQLQAEAERLQSNFDKAKFFSITCGIVTAVFTFLWVLLAIIPATRYSFITLLMAVLTFLSIIVIIPVLFWFMSAQEDYSKRYPRTRAKVDQLNQKMEKEVFGSYVDNLISGYILSPEYCLYEDALEYMIHNLRSRRANNISEATLLCKKKFGRSPIPKIITALRCVSDPDVPKQQAPIKQEKKPTILQMESQGPDLNTIIQLSDYLHTAIQGYSKIQKTEAESSPSDVLNQDENVLLSEYRSLNEEEKKRIRRVVHSLYTNQI